MSKKKIVIKPKGDPPKEIKENSPRQEKKARGKIRGITPLDKKAEVKKTEVVTAEVQRSQNNQSGTPQYRTNKKSRLWIWIGLVLILLLGAAAYVYFFTDILGAKEDPELAVEEDGEISLFQKYNLNISHKDYKYERSTSDREMDVEDFLVDYDLKRPDINKIKREFSGLGLDKISIGDVVTVFFRDDYEKRVEILCIEPHDEVEHWYMVNLSDGLTTQKFLKPVSYRTKNASCVIAEEQLLQAVYDCDIHIDLIPKMEEILKWSIDFYHIRRGDKFKVIYDEKYVDGKLIGIDKVKAIEFYHDGEVITAFGIDDRGQRKYFDERGRTMERKFLLSPLQYGRISSHFDPNRKHPVTGKVKRHGGTDYAAPEGTPIRTVADGRVTGIRSNELSGNLIEITHDKRYKTKYLHCSAYADGIRVGDKVKQGQVIAYVGQTGKNITGAHVCFRFIKDTKEIDHLKANLPTGGKRVEGSLATSFEMHKDSLADILVDLSW